MGYVWQRDYTQNREIDDVTAFYSPMHALQPNSRGKELKCLIPKLGSETKAAFKTYLHQSFYFGFNSITHPTPFPTQHFDFLLNDVDGEI